MAAIAKPRQFRHQRLSSLRSIRILKLLPTREFGGSLEATTLEINLDHDPSVSVSYEALSYVWGMRSGTQPIICDGQLLLITPSCESALRYLRQRDAPRFLWVDAICIDQGSDNESIEERNTQVAMMGEIYNQSKRTVSWLGEGTPFTTQVFQYMYRIGQYPSKRGLKKLLEFDDKLRKEGHLAAEASCLDHIFSHTWHSRIWTVQELAFSTDCMVVCGNANITWDLYTIAARFLIYEEFIYQLDVTTAKSLVGIDMRNVLRDYLLHQGDPNSDNGSQNTDTVEDETDQRITFLTSCLSDVNQLQATDPKDRIYGLYALYTTLGIALPPVDYQKTVEQVYEETAVAIVAWSKSLKILGDACGINRNAGLPSWVPDWQDDEIKLFAPASDATERSRIVSFDSYILSPNPGRLRVCGHIVGRVQEWDEGAFGDPVFPTRPNFGRLPILRKPKYDTVEEEVQILRLLVEKVQFFRTLLQALSKHPQLCHGRDREVIFHEILSLGSDWLEDKYIAPFIDILEYSKSQYDLSFGQIQAELWKREDEAIAAAWSPDLLECVTIAACLLTNTIIHRGERLQSNSEILDLIATASGNLNDRALVIIHNEVLQIESIGTSFSSATVGDSVALLQGADYPVLLRQTGLEWNFIGPVATSRMMEGETWSKVNTGVETMERFTLV